MCPEVAIAVLVGLALIFQGVAGWISFVAFYDENVTRMGSKDGSYSVNGSLISELAVRWDDPENEERLAFRLTRRWFGTASRTETPQGEPDLDYTSGGAWIGARGFRLTSFGLAGVAFYVALLFDVPIVRLIG